MPKQSKEERWHKAALDTLPVIEKRLEHRAATSLDRVLLRLGQALNAKEIKFFQKDGQVVTQKDVVAHHIRLDAAKFLAQLHDAIPSQKVDATHELSAKTMTMVAQILNKKKNAKSSRKS